jgi:hypothetical protein
MLALAEACLEHKVIILCNFTHQPSQSLYESRGSSFCFVAISSAMDRARLFENL